jgi:hypothetical protein
VWTECCGALQLVHVDIFYTFNFKSSVITVFTVADRMEKVTQKDRREKVERTTLASKRVQRSINYVGSRLERDKTKISKFKTFFQKW